MPSFFRKIGIVLFLLFPIFIISQPRQLDDKSKIKQLYIQAIEDFIKDANRRNKTNFDTLYIGNRKDGDPENDFPDIDLPQKIGSTTIILISPDLGLKTQNEIKTRYYVNMIGWLNEKNAEFRLYIFSNGFEHKYNYKIIYEFNSKLKKFALVKIKYSKASAAK